MVIESEVAVLLGGRGAGPDELLIADELILLLLTRVRIVCR